MKIAVITTGTTLIVGAITIVSLISSYAPILTKVKYTRHR